MARSMSSHMRRRISNRRTRREGHTEIFKKFQETMANGSTRPDGDPLTDEADSETLKRILTALSIRQPPVTLAAIISS